MEDPNVIVVVCNSQKFILHRDKDFLCVTDGCKVWTSSDSNLVDQPTSTKQEDGLMKQIFTSKITIEKDDTELKVLGTTKQTLCSLKSPSTDEQSLQLSKMLFSLSDQVLNLRSCLEKQEQCTKSLQSGAVSLTNLEIHKKGTSSANVARKRGMSILNPSVKRPKGPQRIAYD